MDILESVEDSFDFLKNTGLQSIIWSSADCLSVIQKEGEACLPFYHKLFSDIYRLPYHGQAAEFLLDARVNEIMALISNRIETMNEEAIQTLTDFEQSAVWEAQIILKENLQNPPETIAIARKAGLTNRKCKVPFAS